MYSLFYISILVMILNNGWIIHELRSLQRRGSGPRSCSELLRVGYNEGFVVRSACPKGKRCCQKYIECLYNINLAADFMNNSY